MGCFAHALTLSVSFPRISQCRLCHQSPSTSPASHRLGMPPISSSSTTSLRPGRQKCPAPLPKIIPTAFVSLFVCILLSPMFYVVLNHIHFFFQALLKHFTVFFILLACLHSYLAYPFLVFTSLAFVFQHSLSLSLSPPLPPNSCVCVSPLRLVIYFCSVMITLWC